MATTTVTQVAYPVNNFYDKVLLERARKNLVYDMFGQVRNLPSMNTNIIKFRQYVALSQATTALTEGTTPSGSQLSVTDITATVYQYGDFVEYSDWLDMTGLDPIATEAASVLGQQMGETMDSIVRDQLVAGTNVKYGGSQSARGDLTASHVIATADLDVIQRTLAVADAKRITSMVKPDEGYATTPVNASYIGIVHPRVAYTLKGLTGFTRVEYYANSANSVYTGEIGKYGDIRFIESTNAKVFTGEGSSSADVYATLIFGADAYGVTSLTESSTGIVYKPLGSSGTADPLNQRGTVGWKAAKTAKILNQNWLVRYETGVAA